MSTVYVSADCLSPADFVTEQAYFFGSTVPLGQPVILDARGAALQTSLLPATNTRTVFAFGASIYKLLNRQGGSPATIMVRSADGGATWAVQNNAGAPAFQTCSGYFNSTTGIVTCVYINNNAAPGNLRLINFDCNTNLWSATYGAVGPLSGTPGGSIAIMGRPDGTFLVFYESRTGFGAADPSGLGAVSYDPGTGAWSAAFDAGAGILALLGWDATQTIVNLDSQITIDSTGIVHVFFQTASVQVAPVVWGNRVFYQQIRLNNSLGAFYDFPGQVAPFPPAPYNTQQLIVYTGTVFGNPVIIGSNIILPVSMRNDSLLDIFPKQIPGVYVGTPVNAPVWTLITDTIDPGVIADDFIAIQQAPSLTYDGTNLYAVYSAQDSSGQNLARLRMAQTSTPLTPLISGNWTAQTIFDLQVSPSPPGFNFPTQYLLGAGAYSLLVVPPPVVASAVMIDARQLCSIPLPDPRKCR